MPKTLRAFYASLLAVICGHWLLACSETDLADSGSGGGTKGAEKKKIVDKDADVKVDEESDGVDGEEEDEPDDEDDSGDSLILKPKTLRIFRGERVEVTAKFKDADGDTKDVTEKATWKSEDKDVATVSDGKVKGVDAGETEVTASYQGKSGKVDVEVIKCKDISTGTPSQQIRVNGENWPNNSADPGGADFDDYHVTIRGDFIVDGYEIYSKVDQQFFVDYALGTTGSTTLQAAKLQAVDCDKTPTISVELSDTAGTRSLKAAKGDRFNLSVTSNNAGTVRTYELLKDQATAFRIVP